MSLTTDLLLDIASELNGFKIGKPWRFSEFSLVAVIPIIKPMELPRAYRLLSEAKEQVRIQDTGSINKMDVTNNSEFPVLLKSGEILAGATQERALTLSQFVMAGEKVTADCVCVHSTKGIRAGQRVTPVEFCPPTVRSRVWDTCYAAHVHDGYGSEVGDTGYYGSGQQQVWASVNTHSSYLAATSDSFISYCAESGIPVASISSHWETPSDDLTGRIQESQKKFEAALKKIPKVADQIGLCLVSLDGFDSLDVFNHPDSWSAIREALIKSEAGDIANVADNESLFDYRPEKAKELLKKLLGSPFTESKVVEKENTTTILLSGEKLKGEVVTLYEQPIHLSLLKA